MFRTLTIGGREVEFLANAATPYRFRQIFKKDLYLILGDEKTAQEQGINAVTELAFVMYKQAKKVDMNKVNEAEFYDWLEDFGPMDFVDSAEDILAIYMASENNAVSKPKK